MGPSLLLQKGRKNSEFLSVRRAQKRRNDMVIEWTIRWWWPWWWDDHSVSKSTFQWPYHTYDVRCQLQRLKFNFSEVDSRSTTKFLIRNFSFQMWIWPQNKAKGKVSLLHFASVSARFLYHSRFTITIAISPFFHLFFSCVFDVKNSPFLFYIRLHLLNSVLNDER